MSKVRCLLTEILLEVTNGEILEIAKESINRKLSKGNYFDYVLLKKFINIKFKNLF